MSETSPPLPPAWAEVLARIETTVATAIGETREREEALIALAEACDSRSVGTAGTGELERFRQHVQELARCADRAGQAVAGVDAALADDEEALRQWLARVSRSANQPPQSGRPQGHPVG
jgi:hypothetical protein